MRIIRSFTTQAEAAFCASFLQANGFDAELLEEGSFQGGIAGPIHMQVPAEQAGPALELLASPQAGGDGDLCSI